MENKINYHNNGTEQKLCDALLEGLEQNERNYNDCYVYNYPHYFDIESGKMIEDTNPLVKNIKLTYKESPLCFGDKHCETLSNIEFELVRDGKMYRAARSANNSFLKYNRETFDIILKIHMTKQKVVELEREIKNKFRYKIEGFKK